jgi:uncharacterized protein (DUF2267 family)
MNDDYERFITTVQQKASLSREAAERAARATLLTLAERLSQGEARDLAAQLPPPLAGRLLTDSDAERFDAREFLRRVAEREEVGVETAERHVRAVFDALGRTVSDDEIADMVAELPHNFAPLIGEAQDLGIRVVTLEALLAGVADRAGLSLDDARTVMDAVLEILAQRIASGEVDDLIALLPLEARPPLARGKQRGDGKAVRMSLDEFVRRVAEREGVSTAVAREHTAAVLATLRELLPDSEWRDMTAQLPDDYEALALDWRGRRPRDRS